MNGDILNQDNHIPIHVKADQTIEKIESNDNSQKLEKCNTRNTHADMASIVEPVGDEDFYDSIPDGGYGWVIAFIGFLSNFLMFGLVTVWGIFSNDLLNDQYKDQTTMLELMGVSTIALAALNGFTFLNVYLDKLGARWVMFIGSLFISLGMIISGSTNKVWQLYLTQGLMFGLGDSIVYMCIVSVIPQWFTNRRAFAMGICSAGTGVGGLVLSPLTTVLLEKYGVAWAYRILGFLAFGISTISICLIRTRLPPGYSEKPIKSAINPKMFKDMNLMIWSVGASISLMGYYTPLLYIPRYADSIGINRTDTSTIVGLSAALNAIGRIILGFIADKVGRVNTYIVSTAIAGILCMVVWPITTTYGSLLAFSCVFGFFGGIYSSLAAPITANITGFDKLSSGLAILFLASTFSAVGPLIASVIQESTPNNSFIGIQMFCGSVFFVGAISAIIVKLRITKLLFSIY
ncbi:major facilitator superfamily domain-containing protein [Spinellus fusiger]|nr:major facilitator superfamily domain-containing protein [Spinellus fusiger]